MNLNYESKLWQTQMRGKKIRKYQISENKIMQKNKGKTTLRENQIIEEQIMGKLNKGRPNKGKPNQVKPNKSNKGNKIGGVSKGLESLLRKKKLIKYKLRK